MTLLFPSKDPQFFESIDFNNLMNKLVFRCFSFSSLYKVCEEVFVAIVGEDESGLEASSQYRENRCYYMVMIEFYPSFPLAGSFDIYILKFNLWFHPLASFLFFFHLLLPLLGKIFLILLSVWIPTIDFRRY